jgi:hypothetical protein
VDTWTLYDSINEGHRPYAHIWADFQGKHLIGLEVCWDKNASSENRATTGAPDGK